MACRSSIRAALLTALFVGRGSAATLGWILVRKPSRVAAFSRTSFTLASSIGVTIGSRGPVVIGNFNQSEFNTSWSSGLASGST
jgi:hypothetical protein